MVQLRLRPLSFGLCNEKSKTYLKFLIFFTTYAKGQCSEPEPELEKHHVGAVPACINDSGSGSDPYPLANIVKNKKLKFLNYRYKYMPRHRSWSQNRSRIMLMRFRHEKKMLFKYWLQVQPLSFDLYTGSENQKFISNF
jgi:hypothetical protein